MASERVILIRGDHSKWFEQAIFIVKKNIPQASVPVDFVAEAEKIIDGYLRSRSRSGSGSGSGTTDSSQSSSAPGRGRARNAAALIGALILAVLVWYVLKG